MFPEDVPVRVNQASGVTAWVSRGAYKLLKGLDLWGIDPSGKNCVDIGASTGGFTQVLLSRGAAKVTAVDVGYGQFAWVLRNDPRVRLLERTNARFLTPGDIGWEADIVTADASFISLRLLLPAIKGLLAPEGRIIALVKPQFEVGRGKSGKGVVRDPALHAEALRDVALFSRDSLGLSLSGVTYSPIRGPEGNIEFIFLLRGGHEIQGGFDIGSIGALVTEAHGNV
jgi:23S rRNA (cytidine1920-2'-O)/16S rRNA (cytidine1409-2'-O)-methyltransferase